MAKTYLDQLVDYPAEIMKRISEDKYCVGFLVNKNFDEVLEEDSDIVLDGHIFDYQYVDDTTTETAAYIWIEMDVNDVSNRQIKDVRAYVTVACHKNFMKLNSSTYRGVKGNRRDNLVRYIDRLLSDSMFMGIGRLKLKNVRTMTPINRFSVREMTYIIPDFNIVEIDE